MSQKYPRATLFALSAIATPTTGHEIGNVINPIMQGFEVFPKVFGVLHPAYGIDVVNNNLLLIPQRFAAIWAKI
ncbi:MAG: hypothetical protein FWE21_06495 [Defluviitaleaceae bacterium]|nr:hypothetical protein [Defluviitaleaceae bacterium]